MSAPSAEKSSKPVFSIIMPAFNVENFIGEAIDAVIGQSFSSWQLIIIDDHSSDSTPQIIEKLAAHHPDRISFLRLSENLGNPFLVRQKALSLIKGDFTLVLDADDLISPALLHDYHKSFASLKAPDLIFPELWRFSDNNSSKFLPSPDFDTESLHSGPSLFAETLVNPRIHTTGYAVNSDIFREAYKSMPPEAVNSIHADEFFGRLLLLNSRSVAFSKEKYFYRINSSSITAQPLKIIPDGISTNSAILNLSQVVFGNSSKEFALSLRRYFSFLIDALNILSNSRLETSERKKLLNIISEAKRRVSLTSQAGISLPYRLILRLPPRLALPLFSLRRLLLPQR